MNPPDGADKTVEYVNFPLDFPVSAYNPLFLKNALFQFGPWKGTEIELNKKFINDELQKKIASINWNETKLDVRKFLRPEKAEVLDLWSVEFFEKKLLKLKMK